MRKHTAGPWSVGRFGQITNNSNEMIRLEGVSLSGISDPETRANRDLFAAAPDLLEALERLKIEVVLSDVDMDYIEKHFRPWLDKAEAAIKKARGEHP